MQELKTKKDLNESLSYFNDILDYCLYGFFKSTDPVIKEGSTTCIKLLGEIIDDNEVIIDGITIMMSDDFTEKYPKWCEDENGKYNNFPNKNYVIISDDFKTFTSIANETNDAFAEDFDCIYLALSDLLSELKYENLGGIEDDEENL